MKGLRRVLLLITMTWLGAAAAQSAEPAPGVYDSFILLGQSAAFSGPLAELGKEYRRGATLYFDYLNLHGGVHGRSLLLLSKDDGYVPERAVENTKRLLEQDKVFALFGNMGTAQVGAVMPLVAEHRVPLFAPYTGAEQFRNPVNPYVFNVRAGYYQETEALVDYAVRQGKKNIAVFYQDDGFGQAGFEGVQQALKRRNLPLAASGTFPRNTLEIDAGLNAIKAGKPDAVMLISTYAPTTEFIIRAKAAGLHADFYTMSVVGSKALVTGLWLDAEGVVVSQTVPFPDDEDVPLVKEYRRVQRFFDPQMTPSYLSLEGFLAAKVFAQGLEEAGAEPTREKLIATLELFGNRDFGGVRIDWDRTKHSGADYVSVAKIGEQDRWIY